jgi:D-aminopeptidase
MSQGGPIRYTVGALVQSSFGGILTINGAPVGCEPGNPACCAELEAAAPGGVAEPPRDDGSIMMVPATDAP